MKRYIKTVSLALGGVGALILIFYLFSSTKFGSYFSLSACKIHAQNFKDLVHDHYLCAALLYILLVTLVAAMSIPIIVIFALAGGYLFGFLQGALFATIGSTLGSTIAFIVIRYFFGEILHKKYDAQLGYFNEQIKVHGSNYLLILHYLTIVPFFIINTFAALTKISLLRFIITTIAGCFPVFLVYAFAGQELGSINSTSDIFSWPIIIALSLLVFLSLMPIMLKKFQGPKGKQ